MDERQTRLTCGSFRCFVSCSAADGVADGDACRRLAAPGRCRGWRGCLLQRPVDLQIAVEAGLRPRRQHAAFGALAHKRGHRAECHRRADPRFFDEAPVVVAERHDEVGPETAHVPLTVFVGLPGRAQRRLRQQVHGRTRVVVRTGRRREVLGLRLVLGVGLVMDRELLVVDSPDAIATDDRATHSTTRRRRGRHWRCARRRGNSRSISPSARTDAAPCEDAGFALARQHEALGRHDTEAAITVEARRRRARRV